MSTYAILGATGSTGQSLLTLLSASPNNNNTINLLVRSRSKLQNLSPDALTNPSIKVFEGSISDIPTLTSCLANTTAVFLAVASNSNIPGCTIARDTARSVIAALENLKLQNTGTWKAPRLIVLSAAAIEPAFWPNPACIQRKLLYLALSNLYADLEKARAFLRSQDSWVSSTFVMPGGIVQDVQAGHELVSDQHQEGWISYLDVAAAMIEVADHEGGRWEGRNVSLVLKIGRKARVEWWAPWILGKGLVLHYFPWVYGWLV
jgi:putative NADH-flavin reductase